MMTENIGSNITSNSSSSSSSSSINDKKENNLIYDAITKTPYLNIAPPIITINKCDTKPIDTSPLLKSLDLSSPLASLAAVAAERAERAEEQQKYLQEPQNFHGLHKEPFYKTVANEVIIFNKNDDAAACEVFPLDISFKSINNDESAYDIPLALDNKKSSICYQSTTCFEVKNLTDNTKLTIVKQEPVEEAIKHDLVEAVIKQESDETTINQKQEETIVEQESREVLEEKQGKFECSVPKKRKINDFEVKYSHNNNNNYNEEQKFQLPKMLNSSEQYNNSINFQQSYQISLSGNSGISPSNNIVATITGNNLVVNNCDGNDRNSTILNNNNNNNNNGNNNMLQQQISPPISTSAASTQNTTQQLHGARRQQTAIARSTSPTTWHQPQAIQSQQQQQSYSQQQHSLSTQIVDQIPPPPPNAYGMLSHENDVLYITETCIEIGRNSSTSSVHFHVAKNSFVSRKHFQILYDPQTCDFYLVCLSKNGVFVDDIFQRRSTEAVKLPKSCTFRFPSTEIRIAFENFSDRLSPPDIKNNIKNVENNSNVIYSPLKITIPKTEQKSPFPSPTGTISAANSCPTSPRQGFQDYHSYNYNNNNNFQNPPSTSSTNNEHEKPPYSYAQLIVQSISASPDKQLTLSGIYSFISKNYPYYRKEANKGWQNSIRHNLSLNRYFIKVARSQDEPGKGSFWRIDPNSEAKLIDQSYKKRRQRGSQCFRPPYGMPRSAPVSPSQIDNSRENSPLHDIVLQSAPGSPGVSYQNHGENHNAANDEINNYTQTIVQQSPYNSHNQYNISNNTSSSSLQQAPASVTSSSGSLSCGPPLKRHQPSSSGVISNSSTGNSGGGNGGGSMSHGNSDMYDEIDYGGSGTSGNGGIDSGDDCEVIKRQKYTTEVNH